MWNNFGGGTVPQPQPQAQVCSMVVRVSSEQEGRAFLVQRGLTQLMTNLDDSEFYAKTVFIDGREHFEKFPRQPFVQETPAFMTQADVDARIRAALASLGVNQQPQQQEVNGGESND